MSKNDIILDLNWKKQVNFCQAIFKISLGKLSESRGILILAEAFI